MGKKTKIALAIAAASAAAWAGTKAVSKPQKRESKAVLQSTRPVIFAHRGGAQLAPEHSLLAFEQSDQLGVDGFTVSVRLTKDEEIIAFHDATIDRTTEGTGFVKDKTLDELKQFNIGYHFTDLYGAAPYREEGLEVVTAKQLLEAFPTKLFILSIEDSPDTYEGSLMPSKLWRLIEELQAQDRVIISSPYSEQADRFNLYAHGSVALGAGDHDTKKVMATFTSQFGHLFNPKVDVFQVPLKSGMFNFESPKFVKFLADLNIPILYTEIDDAETFNRLLAQNVQGIITNRPDLAEEFLENAY
ncbi:MAG: glycerophosphodiester phosphodiesterase family protein [Solibacillus sp.]